MKDENKKTAITKAIIGLINEIGFANISMSKIAKATGISAATLYVYYKNKEDMFREVYLDVKKHMIEECGRNICPRENVQEAVRKLCKNLLRYMKEYTDEFLFIEQACNSPMATDEMLEELEQYIILSSRFLRNGERKNPCCPMWILKLFFKCVGMRSSVKKAVPLGAFFLEKK